MTHQTNFGCGRTCARWQACRFMPVLRQVGHTAVFSHVSKVDVVIRDLDALETAGRKCGLVLHRGQKTYKWFGQSVGDYPIPTGMNVSDLGKCTHALSVANNPDAYEIGVVAQADGTYNLVWDFWEGGYGLQERVGTDCEDLIADYTIESARNAARSVGWQTIDVQDGTLLILHPDRGTLTVHGNGTCEANGFVGQGCHATAIIENAIGTIRETNYKNEYYAQVAHVRQSE